MEQEITSAAKPVGEIKPVVVVSQCLGFAAVRYNGAMLRDDFVHALGRHVQFAQVCPEVAIGLGVPRDPIRIIERHGERSLVQPSTGRDLSEPMRQFAESFLDNAGPVDGFILKNRSPSCGIKDVKIFAAAEKAPAVGKSTGFFAAAVLRRCAHAAIEDEGRLTNSRLRHHFLTRVFANARLREARRQRQPAALVRFHTEYKLQLMAYSQTGLTSLGRIVANREGLPLERVLAAYAERLAQVMAHPARPASMRNALQHAFGYVSDQLSAKERSYFLSLLEDYSRERLPLTSLLTVLRAWVLRFDTRYLDSQRLFEPYPAPLMELGPQEAV